MMQHYSQFITIHKYFFIWQINITLPSFFQLLSHFDDINCDFIALLLLSHYLLVQFAQFSLQLLRFDLIAHILSFQVSISVIDLLTSGINFNELFPVELIPRKRLQDGIDDLSYFLRRSWVQLPEFKGIVIAEGINFIVLLVVTQRRYLGVSGLLLHLLELFG